MLARTVVVGAGGRLGRAVLARCDASSRGALRNPAQTGALALDAQGFVDPAALAPFETVINCAGLAAGGAEALHAANVALPEALAWQARQAGARRFIQVSSFAVFGPAERISAATPCAPVSAYGRSKLEAERRLLALDGDGFGVTCLRLPFMFGPGPGEGSLLARLVGLALKTRVLPVPRPRPRRSMITFEDAAFAIGEIARSGARGAPAAADPLPFTFEALAAAIREEASRRLFLPWLPGPLVPLIGLAAPKLRDSLLTSSLLDPEANAAAAMALPLGMARALSALVRREAEGHAA